jgi:uncharacterized protein (TIGR02099 family)
VAGLGRLGAKALRLLLWLLAAALLAVGGAFAAFTWGVLPNLDQWRPELERYLSRSVGREVRIAKLSGRWRGVAPELSLQGFSLGNPRQGSALSLDGVAVQPSWTSLLVWEPRFSSIAIQSPRIELVRGKDGVLYLNGVDVSSGPSSDNNFSNWLLRQDRVEIRNASLHWKDDWLGLPMLALEQGNLTLTDTLLGHHLAIDGHPQQMLGQSVSFDASWRGNDVQHFGQWSGKLALKVQGARVGVWSRYLERFGFLQSGHGSGELQAEFEQGQLTALSSDFDVREAGFRPAGVRDIHLPEFSGKLEVKRSSDGTYLAHAHDLTLSTDAGLAFSKASAELQFKQGEDGFGQISLDNIDLAPLAPVIHALAVDRNPLIGRFAPSGKLIDLSASWKGPFAAPRTYRLVTRFDRLGWAENGQVPGLSGASGKIEFDDKGGTLTLASVNTQLNMGHVFARPLSFAKFTGAVQWERDKGGVAVHIKRTEFANADLSGSVAGDYRYDGHGPGHIDLSGSIDSVPAVRVPDYLPYVVGHDTLHWLSAALQGGQARNAQFVLKGGLAQFPFKGGKGGQFSVKADVDGGRLRFDSAWPQIDDIQAQLLFENERMQIVSRQASTLGVPLRQVEVSIPDLDAHNNHLLIRGSAEGPLAKMLAYTVKSPVDRWLDGFTGGIAASGAAKLDLKIDLPLSSAEQGKEKVDGAVDLSGNTLKFTSLPLPMASQTSGRIGFNEHGVDIKNLHLSALGGRFALKADTSRDGKMRFALEGEGDTRTVLQQYVPVLSPFADGRSPYQVKFVIGKGLESLTVASPLIGTRIAAPAPADKAAMSSLPLNVTVRPDDQTHGAMVVDYTLDARARGQIRLDGAGRVQTGTVLIGGADGGQPAHGIAIRSKSGLLDLDARRQLLPKVGDSATGSLPVELDLSADILQAAGYRLSKARAVAAYDRFKRLWRLDLNSQETSGWAELRDQGKPLQIHLARLALPLPLAPSLGQPAAAGQVADPAKSATSESYPAMDVQLDSLSWHGREIGRLEMSARREGNNWMVPLLRVVNKDGSLLGAMAVNEDGNGRPLHVDSNFVLNAGDWGGMLARLGEPNQVIKGKGSVRGRFYWDGGLADVTAAKLNGNASLDVQDGRFARLDTGAARLLGVLSLQAMTRRLRLDFSDLFQSGFAFDKLSGEAVVKQGVFHSDKIGLQGPGANITLKGDVDLAHERQRLQVRVVPYLSESAALGAALVNPIAGVAALAAQKVLQDPLNKMFAVEYLVTGSLNDPDVQPLGAQNSAPSVKKP